MANVRPINKSNPKNIYCGHCKHFENSGTSWCGCVVMVCGNENSEYYQRQRYYYHRCKAFEWSDGERKGDGE